MTHYRGIDYGRGTTNIDTKTGIRFGVIPAHDVRQAWYDSAEPYYGDPHCPKCGNPAALAEDAESESEDDEGATPFDEWEHDKFSSDEYACAGCEYIFGSESAYGEEPLSHTLDDGEYVAEESSGDIFITRSPYYTRAQFCSPCAPGACYLTNPCEDGERAYCFGHDWFEEGKAPYPVYRVSDDSPVLPE